MAGHDDERATQRTGASSTSKTMAKVDWSTLPEAGRHHVDEGSFVNVRTGEIRAYFANPPCDKHWRLLSPRVDLTLDEARALVKRGGFGPLRPDKLHFQKIK